MNQVYIIEAIRTPRGKAKKSGELSDLNPHELLRVLYDDLVDKEKLTMYCENAVEAYKKFNWDIEEQKLISFYNNVVLNNGGIHYR